MSAYTVGCWRGRVWYLARHDEDGREEVAVSPDPRAIEAALRLLSQRAVLAA